MNLTTNQTHILCKHVRSAIGHRNAIECYLKDKLREKNHRLDEYFAVKKYSFLKNVPPTNNCMNDVVYGLSLEQVVESVMVKRQYLDDIRCTIGVGGGGEFLKVSLTIQSSTNETNKETVVGNCPKFPVYSLKTLESRKYLFLELLRKILKTAGIFLLYGTF